MSFKKWIDHKKYRWQTYGWFDACVLEFWVDWIEIPFEKAIKVIQWIPKLWNIRDWEGTDALLVLDIQLARNQKVLKNDPYHIDEKTRKRSGPMLAKEVQEARDCIKRIKEDQYCKKEWKEHNRRFGKLKMSMGKVSQRDKNRKPITRESIFKPDSKASNNFRAKIWKLEEERKKADFDKLFHILKTRIECWWT